MEYIKVTIRVESFVSLSLGNHYGGFINIDFEEA